MVDKKLSPNPRKSSRDGPFDMGQSVGNILNQTVLTVDTCMGKSYPELVSAMKDLDLVLKHVSNLQKDLGVQRRRLSTQASILRRSLPVSTKPAEGDIKSGVNGKSYIFLGNVWGDYNSNPPIVTDE